MADYAGTIGAIKSGLDQILTSGQYAGTTADLRSYGRKVARVFDKVSGRIIGTDAANPFLGTTTTHKFSTTEAEQFAQDDLLSMGQAVSGVLSENSPYSVAIAERMVGEGFEEFGAYSTQIVNLAAQTKAKAEGKKDFRGIDVDVSGLAETVGSGPCYLRWTGKTKEGVTMAKAFVRLYAQAMADGLVGSADKEAIALVTKEKSDIYRALASDARSAMGTYLEFFRTQHPQTMSGMGWATQVGEMSAPRAMAYVALNKKMGAVFDSYIPRLFEGTSGLLRAVEGSLGMDSPSLASDRSIDASGAPFDREAAAIVAYSQYALKGEKNGGGEGTIGAGNVGTTNFLYRKDGSGKITGVQHAKSTSRSERAHVEREVKRHNDSVGRGGKGTFSDDS